MDLRKLSKELQKIVEEELHEDPDKITKDIEYISGWLKNETHLKCTTDDQWLIAFLRGCKYNLELTKDKLANFYAIRSSCAEFYTNRDPFQPEIQEILQAGIHLPLPLTKDGSGPRIIFSDYSKCNIQTITVFNIIKVFLMMLDILLLEDDNYVISGVISLNRFANVTPRYMFQVTPGLIKKGMKCFQDCYPGRVKGMHITSAPSFVAIMFNLITLFASKKLRERITMHSSSNIERFYKILPQEYMPKELGGENGSLPELTEYWKNKVESYRAWYLEDENYLVNKKVHSMKPKTSANNNNIDDK